MRLKLVSCECRDNYVSVGKDYIGRYFRFPRKINYMERVRLYFDDVVNENKSKHKHLYLSEVFEYYFTNKYFTIETKNSIYKFQMIFD